MNVYIAAPFDSRYGAALRLAAEIKAAGIGVTSRWIFGDDQGLSDEQARIDLSDIDAADVMVSLNLPDMVGKGKGGKHVEFGYAIGKMPILLVGVRSHVFHFLSDINHVELADQIVPWLQALDSRKP